jgi:hypothetical protein
MSDGVIPGRGNYGGFRFTNRELAIAERILQGNCEAGAQEPAAWKRAIRIIGEMEKSLDMMLRAHEQLMPCVKNNAVQDYAILNDAPLAALAVLEQIKETRAVLEQIKGR